MPQQKIGLAVKLKLAARNAVDRTKTNWLKVAAAVAAATATITMTKTTTTKTTTTAKATAANLVTLFNFRAYKILARSTNEAWKTFQSTKILYNNCIISLKFGSI